MRMYKHLEETNESYKEHMWIALRMSGKMFIGGIKGLVHAIIPDLFTTSVTDTCKDILEMREIKD